MGREPRPAPALARGRPWFQHAPRRALAVAAVMFVAIFALSVADSSATDAVSVLYVLPVALVAFTFGFRAGLAAGGGAVGLLALSVLIADLSMSPLGWATRITPLLLLGTLVGYASDQLREGDRRELHYQKVALLQREAAEINDGIVQGLAAAKWLLEAGNTGRGLDAVNDTIVTAQTLVSRMLGPGSPLEGELLRSLPRDARGDLAPSTTHDGRD